MRKLEGRVVIVTGASSGIGAATSVAFGREKARVALAARRRDKLAQVAEEVRRQGGEALVVPTDVTSQDAAAALARQVVQQWGRIDVLVNNAGRGLAAPFEQTTVEELHELFWVNLASVLMVTQAVLPVMRRQRSGHIINISSIAGRRGTPWRSAYCATKFALHGLTESLRQELRGTGIVATVATLVDSPTEFHDVEVKKLHLPDHGFHQPVEAVARSIIRAAKRPRPEIYPYPLAKAIAVLAVIAPGLVDALASRAARRGDRP